MQLNTSYPICSSPPHSTRLQQDPDFVKAYGHVVTLMQTKKSDKDKIALIMDIVGEAIETSALQQSRLAELEKENEIDFFRNIRVAQNCEFLRSN